MSDYSLLLHNKNKTKVSSTLSRYEIMVTNDGVCYREREKKNLYDKCTHLFFQQDLSRTRNIILVKSRLY